LAPTILAFDDTLEARSLQIICLDAPLGGRPIRQQALEGTARYANHPTILADPHPELDCFSLGIPPGIVWKGKEHQSDSALRARPEIIESTSDRVNIEFTTVFLYHIWWS
jgi:hypothetical protein